MLSFFAFLAQAQPVPGDSSAGNGFEMPWGTMEHVWAVASMILLALVTSKASRYARLAKATFAGIRAALADKASGKPMDEAAEDAIQAAATELGVSKLADQHIGEGLGTPPAPPPPSGLTPGAGPGVKS
jgi:hypothetical protein